MKKKKPKIAALQKPHQPAPPAQPVKAEPPKDELSIELGYELKNVSECCGAPTYERLRINCTAIICRKCKYDTKVVRKITRANLIPAYGNLRTRRPHLPEGVLDLLYRGLDFQIIPSNRLTSIREMAPGAILQIRYGKRLHKIMAHTINLALKK